MDKFVSLNNRSRSIIYRSFVVSLVALLLGAVIVGFTASAANYTAFTSGAVNWTAVTSAGNSAVWGCGTVGIGDSCGIYPGQIVGNPFVDNANVATGSALTINVTTPIPSPITLNVSGFGDTIAVNGGGTLQLTNASAITSTSGLTNSLQLNGGTITNTGTVTVSSVLGPANLSFNGGTLNGGGQVTVNTALGTMNITGTLGPMSMFQTINNNSNVNYNAFGVSTLTVTGSSVINNNAGGTFNNSGNASILAVAGSPLFQNFGTYNQTTSSGPETITVPFQNTGIVNLNSTTLTLGGGSGPGLGHTGAFNLGGGSLHLGGPHSFFTGSSIAGLAGSVVIDPGALNVMQIATAAPTFSLPNAISLDNGGTISFQTGPLRRTLNIGGTFTNRPTGTLDVSIGPPSGNSDKVAVTGVATLGGTFVAGLGGGYAPSPGDTFTVLTDNGRVGDFATKSLPTAAGTTFTAQYTGAAPEQLQLLAVTTADIGVTKTGPASVFRGQPASYTVTLTNFDTVNAATNVVITDNFTGGTFNAASSSPGCVPASATSVTCTVASVPANNGQVSLTIVLDATAASSITDSATLTSLTQTDTNPANNTSATITTTVNPAADLAITKTGTLTAIPGGPLSYTINVTNAGPDPVTTFTVIDNLPAGVTAPAGTGTGWVCTPSGSFLNCTYNGAAVFAPTAAPPLVVTMNAPAAGGNITDSATVSVIPPTVDPNSTNDGASATTTIAATADLSVVKTAPAVVTAGQPATFTIAVTNNGPSPVASVTVNDAPGAGLIGPPVLSAPCASFPCTLSTFSSGQTQTITATWNVDPNATGTVSNTASIGGSGVTDPNALNDSSTASQLVTVNSDLQIAKTGPATAFAGQTITYTINVLNNGPSTATGVVVNDPTPPGTTAGPVTSTFCSAFPCNIGTLLPGAGESINATYTINPATTTVTNTAIVGSTSADPNGANNSATATTTVTPKADLSITKVGPSTIPASGQITYTITVKNNGPSTANNVFVNDSPGIGLTFLSNSGGCTTPFPCSYPTVASGNTITIQSTFKVAAGANSVTNTADVNSSTVDPNNGNNSATVTTGAGNTCPNGPLAQFQPFSGQQDAPTTGQLQWTNVGATSYDVYLGPAGTGCSTLVATVNGTSYDYSGLQPNTDYESRIIGSKPGCPSLASLCIRWRTANEPGGCNLTAPQLIAPVAGSTVGGQTKLKWSAVSGATSYHVVVKVNGVTAVDATTTDTFLDVTLPDGSATWSVTAISANCTGPASTGSFNACGPPQAPIVGVVGAPSSGSTYQVLVLKPAATAVSYEFQEATDPQFSNPVSQTTNATNVPYTHTTNVAEVFYYRVRATGACTNAASLFSKTVRVVIVPNVINLRNPKVNVPAGNKDLVVVQVQIPGDGERENFAATADRPWIVRIDPSSGILPADGIILNVTIDPAQLPNGTFTATVIVTTSPISGISRLVTNGGSKSVPVSINLVTPVVPVNPNAPTSESIFIPAVGHLAGLNSQWRSDIRIYNASPQPLQYLLNFTPQGSTDVKQTTLTTASGDTSALDDIIHNWFGIGEVGDSSTGVLEIRPMTTDGAITPPQGSSFLTVVSSRTFNAQSDGTVGQFIPPVKFTNFIGNGARLSMQQLAQTQAYRTNFGLVEGSGSPVSLVLSMFNSGGTKLFDLPVNLAAGEQKLLNGLLAQQGVTLADGRMEVRVAGGDGKVTAYASVIDNASLDPQLVPGQNLTNTSSKLYVVPGVADLNNGVATWRTDMRVYNSGNAPQSTEFVFYPEDKSAPFFTTLTVNPNEVKVLDNIVRTLFSTHDVGGMVQLTTPVDSQLVVTARTYNQTANGTLGQFIKAATGADGITTNTKSLNILQVEDSPRFRTNLGLAEMTGKPATVEVSVILPDSKVTPSIQVPLAANEFRQFSVGQFGLGNIYNARVSVKVIDGAGSVTAYGSVIDQVTTDPTYVQAQ